jgi:signal transduction histidine kinase/FixJ family two-component response regulator
MARVGTTLGFERLSVFASDPEGRRLTCTHRWHADGAEMGWESLEAYPVPAGALARLEVTENPRAERWNAHLDDWLSTLQREAGAHTLHAPIGYGGRVLGLLVGRLQSGRAWNQDDASALRRIGEVIAIARVRRAAELALRAAKEAAVAASAAKSSFLANISHELRTPLNGVIGMVDLLASTRLDEHQRRFCDVAGSSANALLAVINDVLDFSKIEANKLELDVAAFDPRGVIDEVVDMLSLQAQSRGLELTAKADSTIGDVLGDAARVRQILVNLVSNAIKFTPRGAVTVRSRGTLEGDGAVRVRVEVEDTGVGLPADAQRLLFKPFSQVDGSPARRQGGTGLGLAISRDLVELMKGRIGVVSDVGRGSTFWFEIPFARAPLGSAPRRDRAETNKLAPASSAPLAGRRVLVVEDSPVNALVTTELLRRAGATYELADSGSRAIDAMRAASFDVVLMDCHLPDMDGYDTTERLRARGVQIPIIALTASATTEDLARCFAAGMNDRIVKPVDARRFVDVVVRHLEPQSASSAKAVRTIDIAGALERMRGDRDLFTRVCARLAEIAPGERGALAAAVQARDLRAVAALGHRLRGQAGTLGGHALMDSLAALESVAAESR